MKIFPESNRIESKKLYNEIKSRKFQQNEKRKESKKERKKKTVKKEDTYIKLRVKEHSLFYFI
jgi:hypothetical protein